MSSSFEARPFIIESKMLKFKIFVVCLSAFVTSCLTAEDNCSKLGMMEQLLEKMIRTELKFEKLETNVDVVHTTVDTALKSAGNQIEQLESKLFAFEEDVAKKLEMFEEQFNNTNIVIKKLTEHSLDAPMTTCPDEWTSFHGSCYYFGTADVSRNDAQRVCEEVNANLANIETEAENNFLRAQLRQKKAPKHWIAMTDEAEEGRWLYQPSGIPVTYFDWGANQPNNYRISNCMAIWESFGYLWVDEPCKNRFRPICEKSGQSLKDVRRNN